MALPVQTFGVTLPITHGPSGYFNQSYTLLEQIKSNLVLLLQTKKGERRMNPEFGSGLWNILFENIADNISPIIESTIRKDIGRWMAYVNVQSVNVTESTVNPNQLNVSLSFTVPSVGITQAQTLQVSMNNTSTI